MRVHKFKTKDYYINQLKLEIFIKGIIYHCPYPEDMADKVSRPDGFFITVYFKTTDGATLQRCIFLWAPDSC